jgi:hypothetical protein
MHPRRQLHADQNYTTFTDFLDIIHRSIFISTSKINHCINIPSSRTFKYYFKNQITIYLFFSRGFGVLRFRINSRTVNGIDKHYSALDVKSDNHKNSTFAMQKQGNRNIDLLSDQAANQTCACPGNNLIMNRKFWEELNAYFHWYDTGHIENSFIVAYVFVTAVTFLPSRCLATIRGFLPSRCLATIGRDTQARAHTQTAYSIFSK